MLRSNMENGRPLPCNFARWALVALLPLLCACDCDTLDIPPDPPTKGTICIQVQPDSLAATWTLDGPHGWTQSGAGPDTLGPMSPGTYSCTWDEVPSWQIDGPSVQEFELAAGDTAWFQGVFQPVPEVWDTWVFIPAGQFMMGASVVEETALRNEKPQHQVTLTGSFLMQATEVTNAQYLEQATWALTRGWVTADQDGLYDNLHGATDLLADFGDQVGGQFWSEIKYQNGLLQLRDIGHGLNPDHPVKMVTWYGAAAYCDWLNMRQELPLSYDHSDWSIDYGTPYDAPGYRLPTEAEWEYACRAGTTTPFYSGDITDPWGTHEPALDTVAWYQGNSIDWTHPVAHLEPNAWGLYDLHGNVFKWVNGFEYGYEANPATNPVGGPSSGNRVAKGGAWTRPSHYHRTAFRRLRDTLDYRGPKQGFRPVRRTEN